jgi:hypothetical protein
MHERNPRNFLSLLEESYVLKLPSYGRKGYTDPNWPKTLTISKDFFVIINKDFPNVNV